MNGIDHRIVAAAVLALLAVQCGGKIEVSPRATGAGPAAAEATSASSSSSSSTSTSSTSSTSSSGGSSTSSSSSSSGSSTSSASSASSASSSGGGPVDGGLGQSAPVLATGNPSSLAVDATALYWTDLAAHTINKRDKIGGTPTVLATSAKSNYLSGPYFIATDGAYVYWTEWNDWDGSQYTGSIHRVPTGGGADTILATGEVGPRGIAVDATSIYWTTTARSGTVRKADLDGSNVRTIATGQVEPAMIAVRGNVLTWATSDWPNGTIVRSGLEGEDATTLFSTSKSFVFGVATDGTSVFFLDSVNEWAHFRVYSAAGSPPSSSDLATGAGGSYRSAIAFDDDYFWFSWFGGDGLVKMPRAGGAQTKLQPYPYGSAPCAYDIVVDDAYVYWTEPVSTPSVIKFLPK